MNGPSCSCKARPASFPFQVRFEQLVFPGRDYRAGSIGAPMKPAELLLAKFEACSDAGCFDVAYEASKAKAAVAAAAASG